MTQKEKLQEVLESLRNLSNRYYMWSSMPVIYKQDLDPIIDILEQSISQLQGEKTGRGDCPDCNGFGYTAEHNPADPHPDGECSGGCPIQVECQKCEGTGWLKTNELQEEECYPREFVEWVW